jgi:hypothetical protein
MDHKITKSRARGGYRWRCACGMASVDFGTAERRDEGARKHLDRHTGGAQ